MLDFQRGNAGLFTVTRFQRRNRAAGIAADVAQGIQRGVITRRNIAARLAFCRRRKHQRAGKQIGQRAVARQIGQQRLQQGRPVRNPRQQPVHRPRLFQPVTHLPQVSRRTAPRHQPPQRPPQIGQRAQHPAQIAAQQRIAVQPFHQGQPRLDPRALCQGRRNIIRQQPRARASGTAVNRRNQAALAPALLAAKNFERSPRRRINRHMCAIRPRHRGQ